MCLLRITDAQDYNLDNDSIFFLSLLSFVFLYLRFTYIFESEITVYGSYFIQYLFDAFIPVVITVSLLKARLSQSWGRRFLSAFKMSVPRVVHLFPYYYLYYMSEGFDSLEALGLFLIRSLFMLILFSIECHVYYLVANFFAKRAESADWNFGLSSEMKLFDLSKGIVAAVFTASFLKFVMNLISEGIDVLLYLLDYGEFYSTSEIFYVLTKLVLAFAALFLTHVIIISLRGKLFKSDEADSK